MSEYTVARVSTQAPRTWKSKFGPMETYKVMFEGNNDAIEINRKPGNRPNVGDVLTGTIETSEFGGNVVKKFKSAPRQNPTFTPKDTSEIKAEWAIGQAISWLVSTGARETTVISDIEPLAKDLFRMVERIKSANSTGGYEKAKAIATQLKTGNVISQTFSDGTPLPSEETINLDEIPF